MLKAIKRFFKRLHDDWTMCSKEARGYNCQHRPNECDRTRKDV